MTIDEFKKNIAPYMRKGYVAMDENGVWNWWERKPEMKHDSYWWVQTGYQCCLSDGFDIAPADDWTKSLIKIDNTARENFEEEYQNNTGVKTR